jgi:hypothetical protein
MHRNIGDMSCKDIEIVQRGVHSVVRPMRCGVGVQRDFRDVPRERRL